ncbi:MAG: hypothetical protein ACI4QI_01905 [Candidatus Coproplasma sp.]
MNISKELIQKAKTAKTAEELLEMAKAEGVELSKEEAARYFAELNKSGELSDEELDNVSGGDFCSPSDPPKYKVGDYVEYYYRYEMEWYRMRTTYSIATSVILDIKADGSNWTYKLEKGTHEHAEYIEESRIISISKGPVWRS